MTYVPNRFGMSNIGNTSGTTGTVGNGIVFAGGNNVTLSQSINNQSATVSISAANQSVQTQNIQHIGVSGNTAGVGTSIISSGTLTLSAGANLTFIQNNNFLALSGRGPLTAGMSSLGNTSGDTGTVTNRFILAGGDNITLSQSTDGIGATVTISGANGGGAGFSAGVSNLGNTSGTSGTASNQLVLAGGDNITLSQSTGAGGNTVTISAAAGGGADVTLSRYQNMDRGTTAALAFPYNSVFMQRLNQENDLFAGHITANTMLFNLSGSASTGASSTQTLAAHTLSMSIGIYQPVSSANTVLTLINSASTSFGSNATMSAYPYYYGNRWASIHSSQWSSTPSFDQNGDYVFAMLVRSSGTSTAFSFIGQNYMNSQQRSGFFGVSTTSGNTSMPHGNYWNALYSVSSSALPTVISGNQVNRNNATAIFIPHLMLNNQYTY